MGYEYYVGAISTAQEGAWDMYARRAQLPTRARALRPSLWVSLRLYEDLRHQQHQQYLRYSGEDVIIEASPHRPGHVGLRPGGAPNYWLSPACPIGTGEKYVTTSLLHLKTTTVNAAGPTVTPPPVHRHQLDRLEVCGGRPQQRV